MIQNATDNRLVWLDVVRVVAMMMVIGVHCVDPFNVSPIARANPDYNFWGAVYGSLLRASVPLFVMMTGLLLLPVKKQPLGQFYKKRIFRVLFPFLIWSVLYNLFPWITGLLGLPASIISDFFAYASPDASQEFSDALHNVIRIPLKFSINVPHMWYIYLLIGLYLYLPFFSGWIEGASSSMKKTFLGIWFVSLLLPYLLQFVSPYLFGTCPWNGYGMFYYFSGFAGYLVLGHYLKNGNDWSLPKTGIISLILFAVGYAITYIGFRTLTANPNVSEPEMELFFLFCSPNVVCMTIAVFLMLQKVKVSSPKISKVLTNTTKCGFGIYMVHYFLVGPFFLLMDWLGLPIGIQVPIMTVSIFIVAWGFTNLIYKLLPRQAHWIMG